jgi:hypothetical protein
MMEWGVVHGWINTLILGVLGLAVLANPRWRRFRWFVCYALIGTALAVVYKLFFLTYEFYLLKFIVTNLLALGAVVELVRSEKSKVPFWSWGALLCLVVVPFLPIDWNLRFTLAPLVLYFGQALSIQIALQCGNVLLIGMSVMGLSYFAAAIIKLFSEFEQFWAALRYLDPWFFTVIVSLMVIGVYLPQILKVLKRSAAAIRSWRPASQHLQPAPAGTEGVGLRDSDPASCSVYQFPAAARSGAQNHLSEGAALRFMMDEILERFDTMEEALAAAATISMSARKTFLSLSDLAVYLGVSEDVAERFVEHRRITKIPLTGEGGAWVVARSSIDAELLEDEED